MKTLPAEQQRTALASKIRQMGMYYWSVFRAIDEPVEPITTRAPIGATSVLMWLYERSSEIIGRDVDRAAWMTKVGHNSWIDDTYAPRELGITTNGEIVESYTVQTGTGPIVYLRIVGPSMPLSDEDLNALTALADQVIARYHEG